MKPFDKLETNKPFPGVVHLTEGVHIELRQDFLAVFIQKPALNKSILSAFKKGFSQYSYLETDTLVPVAYWVFRVWMVMNRWDTLALGSYVVDIKSQSTHAGGSR
jgi:hypothetical protein